MIPPAATPAAGRVKTQESKMSRMVGQCVPPKPLTKPTPAIDPVTVWVVETGTPNIVAKRMVAAALVSAVHPRSVFNLVILCPRV